MAVAVDGSTPARWNAILEQGAAGSASGAFTAPANSLLVCTVQGDTNNTSNVVLNVTDSSSLTWTKQVERNDQETAVGGYCGIHTAVAASSTSRTVTMTWASGGTGDTTRRYSAKCYVLTGGDTTGTPFDSITANNEGTSGTNSFSTTSITPGATGLLVVSDCEWNELGVFDASSDLTQDTADYSGEISVDSGYKVCTSGVGVTANLNAAGSGTPQHKWCQVIARVAPSTFIAAPARIIKQAVNRAATY